MLPFLKQGEEIAIDVYKDTWKSRLLTKYWVRPITKKMDKRKLLKIIQTYIPIWFPISTLLLKVPIFGKFLCQIILICNNSNQFSDLSKEQLIEWAILDTFDMLSPKYDQPQTFETFKKWLIKANL